MAWWTQLLGGPDIGAQDRYIDDWLKGMEPGIATATGLRVTIDAALACPGIAACIQVQSEDLAKVPLLLKRRSADGFEEADDHPLFDFLKFGPSPWLSSYRWRKTMVHVAMAHGNHYSRNWRNGIGGIDQISPIQPGQCIIRWAADGEPFFDIMTPGGIERGLSWQDVIHVAYRDSTDGAINGGVLGVSPILQHKESVALMIAAEKFAGAFFANGAQPSMILEYDKKLPNDEVARRVRAGIERVYSGLDNKWKVAILEYGIKMRETSLDPEKSQLVETRKLAAEIACTMYRTPPHKIGLLDRATFSNIEQQETGYVTGTLSGQAKSVESALEVACLLPAERRELKVEHNLEGLMRGDILSRYRAYAIGRQWGWLNVNEIRHTENQNAIGPDGEEYLVPLNMVPANSPEDPMKDDPKPANGKAAAVDPGAWLSTDVRWTAPAAAFESFRRGERRSPHGQGRPVPAQVSTRRPSTLVGAAGERLYLN